MKKFLLLVLLCLYCLNLIGAGTLKDSESKSHSQEASRYQLVDKYPVEKGEIYQFDLSVLSHYSYFLVSGNEVLIVDPGRDAAFYEEYIQKNNWVLKGIFLTHSHADFVAGHMELIEKCPIMISKDANAEYKHRSLNENDIFQIGELKVKFLKTPGHTLDGMCGVVLDPSDNPQGMFSGDTLFVGSVGRPDLMGGTISASDLASLSYDTWHNKLSLLPDDMKFFPAHGAGSLCGAHLGDEPFSTIKNEKLHNIYIMAKSRSEFIALILDGLPKAPQYFGFNAAMNRKGPEKVQWEKSSAIEMKPEKSLMDSTKFQVIDLREADEFALGHIPESINISIRGRLETWTGIMIPWGSKVVLTGDTSFFREAETRLHRIGYKIHGIIDFDVWKKADLPVYSNERITPVDLYSRVQKGTSPLIIDVRLPKEWMGLRIGTIINFPINELSELSAKLNPQEEVVTVCNSAFRSSLAIGVMERKGFKKVMSLEGGTQAWIDAGLPVISPLKNESSSTGTELRPVNLPRVISSEELGRILQDLPDSIEIIDLRPSANFKDFNLPQSRNMHPSDVLGKPLPETKMIPVLLVDRDGSVALPLGGALIQKTSRPVYVLYGGLEAYWKKTLGGVNSQKSGENYSIPQVMPQQNSTPATPVNPLPVPEKKKKTSAGC